MVDERPGFIVPCFAEFTTYSDFLCPSCVVALLCADGKQFVVAEFCEQLQGHRGGACKPTSGQLDMLRDPLMFN